MAAAYIPHCILYVCDLTCGVFFSSSIGAFQLKPSTPLKFIFNRMECTWFAQSTCSRSTHRQNNNHLFMFLLLLSILCANEWQWGKGHPNWWSWCNVVDGSIGIGATIDSRHCWRICCQSSGRQYSTSEQHQSIHKQSILTKVPHIVPKTNHAAGVRVSSGFYATVGRESVYCARRWSECPHIVRIRKFCLFSRTPIDRAISFNIIFRLETIENDQC